MSLSTSTTNVRVAIRDNSATTANQMFSDAQIYVKINDAMRLVQRKFFPRIGQVDDFLTITKGNFSANTTATNYARIIAITPGTTFGGAFLQWQAVDEFFSRRGGQQGSFNAPAGTVPYMWTAWRLGSSVSAANQGKWTVAVIPGIPASGSDQHFSALVEFEQADLSTGTDTMDLPPEGITMVEHLSSFWLGSIKGMDYADSFLKAFPELKELATADRARSGAVEGRRG